MYNTDYSENIHSYVNNINTIEGGTHLTGFRIALTRTLKAYADADPVISKQIEKAKIEIAGETSAKASPQSSPSRWQSRSSRDRPRPSWVTAGWLCSPAGCGRSSYLLSGGASEGSQDDMRQGGAGCHSTYRCPQGTRDGVQRKNRCRAEDCQANWPTAPTKTPKTVRYSSSRVIPPVVQPNRGRDRYTQAILPLRGKILNVKSSVAQSVRSQIRDEHHPEYRRALRRGRRRRPRRRNG